MVNEEGLAAINTIYQAQVKMLFLPALLYCKYFKNASSKYRSVIDSYDNSFLIIKSDKPPYLSDTACMSTEMSFKELFEHLAMYIYDPEQRWKQVVRAKRCLPDCSEVGGCGYDQCYFEGRSKE